MCICLTLQTLIATYLLACESEASICSEALRVWPHFLEKTFGLKHSFCNFLLFFFLPKWLILTGVVWLFMSVHQTELNSVWQAHLKGKKEKRGKKTPNTMGSCLFRGTYSNVTQHYRHTHYYCTVASNECLWWMFGFFCSHFNKCQSLSAWETLALIFHEASPIWIGSEFLGEKKPWSQVDAIIVPM